MRLSQTAQTLRIVREQEHKLTAKHSLRNFTWKHNIKRHILKFSLLGIPC